MLRSLLVICIFSIAPWNILALWPIPRNLTTGTTFLKLDHSFDIIPNIHNPPQDLLDAITRTKWHIQNDKLGRLVVGRGVNDSAAILHASSLPSLSMSLSVGSTPHPIAVEATRPLSDRSETYSLIVPADGSPAKLLANSTLGLLRGLTTFEQLWYDFRGLTYTYMAPVMIMNDSPAFVSHLSLL
jgi:hexosaminidase